ncbi:phage GP46 family protein [Sphingopyxis granuli]|uniref:phage GP46 family protein n=1 Tax=Sphingopyxis granuli TaxID=267128 RepID=UPI001BAEA50E|nr:phage GP46 family protein [Sphingopyxis granuli]QUM72175.1 phage GP46 family protein [Sphingopyxis granuli]
MTDVAIRWSNDSFSGDLAFEVGRLVTDDGLHTAIFLSLFTDARAREDDRLPDEGADPRGWWGNAFSLVAGRELGSRLWLLAREKITAVTVERARVYAVEALAWLKDDGIVSGLAVEATRMNAQMIALKIVIDRPEGPSRQVYDFVWEASL